MWNVVTGHQHTYYFSVVGNILPVEMVNDKNCLITLHADLEEVVGVLLYVGPSLDWHR